MSAEDNGTLDEDVAMVDPPVVGDSQIKDLPTISTDPAVDANSTVIASTEEGGKGIGKPTAETMGPDAGATECATPNEPSQEAIPPAQNPEGVEAPEALPGNSGGNSAEENAADDRSRDLTEAVQKARDLASEAVTKDLEDEYVRVCRERDVLRERSEELRSELEATKISSRGEQVLKSELNAVREELSSVQQKLSFLEEEKTLVQERSDRIVVESDRLREELSILSTSNKDLTKSVGSLETQLRLKDSEAIPLWHDKERLLKELDTVNSHAQWLEQELDAKQRAYQRLQQESRDRAIQLQLQLDQTANEKEANSARLEALQEVEGDLQTKISEVSKELLRSQQELHDVKENAGIEIREERTIVDLQKEQLKRWEQRYEDLIRENEALKRGATEASELAEKEIADQRELMKNEFALVLKKQVAEYEEKLRIGGGRSQTLTLPVAVLDSEAVNRDEEEPMSLTDLYTRLEETKVAWRREQAERKRWQLQFERVQKDIAQTAPRMIRQREEYELAMEQLQDYQHRLQQALTECDDLRETAKEEHREAVRLGQRLAERQAESQELAKQVQALLVSRAGGQVDGSVPTSVAAIQSQNQRLLAEHRRLSNTVAELEDRLETDSLKNKMEAAVAELALLHHQREEQEESVTRIVQQRDMYRALLSKIDNRLIGSEGEGDALDIATQQSSRANKLEERNKILEADLAGARSELSRVRRDMEAVSERTGRFEIHSAELKESVDDLQRHLLIERSNVARNHADSEYHKERCGRLEGSLDRARAEISQLSASKAEMQRINTSLQENVSVVSTERVHLESEVRQAETKIRFVETQLSSARMSEARLTEENGQLRNEVARQGAVIESVRRIESSLLGKKEGQLGTLSDEIERLRTELKDERSKNLTETYNLKARTEELEALCKENASARDKIHMDFLKAKEELLAAKSEVQAIKSNCSLLESRLQAAKKKLGEDMDEDSAAFSLQSRVDSLVSELEGVRAENVSLKERASKFSELSKQSEEMLVEVKSSLESTISEKDANAKLLIEELEALKLQNKSSQDIIRDLTVDLASQREERESIKTELQRKIGELSAELEGKSQELDSACAAAAAMKMDMDQLREDVTTGQNNYERELVLHSQARTALRAAREEIDSFTQEKRLLEDDRDRLAAELAQREESLEQQKASTDTSIKLLEKSLQQARDQNSHLQEQLLSVAQVNDMDTPQDDTAGQQDSSKAPDHLKKVLQELRENISFLRGENKMTQTQLDTAKRKAERERAAAAILKRSLEEARAEVNHFRSLVSKDGGAEAKKHQATLESLNATRDQVRLLTESNTLLRDEAEQLRAELGKVQQEFSKLNQSIEPTKKIEHDMGVTVASLEAEKASLRRELDSWKKRVTDLVSRFNQVDPEEHKKLQATVATLEKEKESLNAWKTATEEESARIRSIAKTLNLKGRQQKEIIDSQTISIKKLTAEKESLLKSTSASAAAEKEIEVLKNKMSGMERHAETAKTELAGANDRVEKLRTMLRKYRETVDDLKMKEKSLSEQLTAAKKDSSTKESTKQVTLDTRQVASNEKGKVANVGPGPNTVVAHLPKIPDGGFKFGPSAKFTAAANTPAQQLAANAESKSPPAPTKAIEKTTLKANSSQGLTKKKEWTPPPAPVLPIAPKVDLKQGTTPSSLNVRAVPFSPPPKNLPTTTERTSAKVVIVNSPKPSPPPVQPEINIETDSAPTTGAQKSSPEKSAAELSSRRDKKEMSIKEKLMEKKRRLVEGMERKRKQALELSQKKARESASNEEQAQKRQKIESGESGKQEAQKNESESGGSELPVKKEQILPATAAKGAIPESADTSQPINVKNVAAAQDSDEQVSTLNVTATSKPMVVETKVVPPDAKEVKPDTPSMGSVATAFGGSSSTFGSTSTVFGPSSPGFGSGNSSTFGSSVAPANPTTSAFGSAFLDMKPPGTSTDAPSFSFGSTPTTFKIPTPSQPAPAALPFGAFSGTPLFGSFGGGSSSTSTTSGAIPLFGAPPPKPEETPKDEENKEQEEMKD